MPIKIYVAPGADVPEYDTRYKDTFYLACDEWIIFLNEVLLLDRSDQIASQNLMAAYYNCAVELYNKTHYDEALPVLKRAIELGTRSGPYGLTRS